MKPLATYDPENNVITFQNGKTLSGSLVESVEFETDAVEIPGESAGFKKYIPGDRDITLKLVPGFTIDGKTEIKASEYRDDWPDPRDEQRAKLTEAVKRIHHYALGKCDIPVKNRLQCIARECEAEQFIRDALENEE